MLLTIGLQSGKGLHPDPVQIGKIIKLQKIAEVGGSLLIRLITKLSVPTAFQFGFFGNSPILAIAFIPVFVYVLSFRRSRAPRPCGARSCTCHKSFLLMP